MSNANLAELFSHPAVQSFGQALRWAITSKDRGGADDYSSLIEFEWTEDPVSFAEALKKFLRRYHSYAAGRLRKNQPVHVPDEKELDGLVTLVDSYGVRLVRAALVSHALVWSSKKDQAN